MGSLSVTWEPKYREPFAPLIEPVAFIPYNDVEALKEAVDEETAAVILEPVQGEGGVRPATPEFLQAAREITREKGALLILDEIQTGMGRTGRRFAFEHYGVVPDILTLAKALGGGVPIGAAVMRKEVAESMPKGGHGSTFGGNPLAMAAGVAALRYLERTRLWERAAELGPWFMEKLREIPSPKIREVRGLGSWWAWSSRKSPPPTSRSWKRSTASSPCRPAPR
jgi:acetylornithine/LysW-gamma-L-lysine aminotransferase